MYRNLCEKKKIFLFTIFTLFCFTSYQVHLSYYKPNASIILENDRFPKGIFKSEVQRSSKLCQPITDYSNSYWEVIRNDPNNFQILIQAVDECNKFRKSGGDVFVANAYSSSGIIAGQVHDKNDGSYLLTFKFPGYENYTTYHVKVMLGIRIGRELFDCDSMRQHECHPQFFLKLSQLKHVTQCIWEYVMPRKSEEFIKISYDKQAKFCSKAASSKFEIQGMWRKIDTCLECTQCKSMQKMMSKYAWKHSFIYDTFEFQQKWYFSSKDLKRCKYGKSIAFAGDSVTKKGFLASSRNFNIPIKSIGLYNILDVGTKNENKKSKMQLSALIRGTTKFSAVVLGTGRHDLRENSIEEYMVHFKNHIFPILKKLNSFGTKIVWVLTSAPRHREPASTRERLHEKIGTLLADKGEIKNAVTQMSDLNHSCINFIHGRKEQCLQGVDSCRKYAQRWDRIIELNYQLRLFFKEYTWINIFDSFQMTNSGMWEWYDDNVHHH